MIKTKNLSKTFTTAEVETTALNNVNAEIQDGEFVAIMGPSGCGKSTFLHIAGMLDNPYVTVNIFSWARKSPGIPKRNEPIFAKEILVLFSRVLTYR